MTHSLHARRKRATFWSALVLALLLGWGGFLLFRSVGTFSLQGAPPPEPEIVTREDWGARPLNLEAPEEFGLFDPQTNPKGVLYYPDELSEVLNTMVVHHSATAYSSPNEVQNLHMDGRGFADVAYHFMIAVDGTIYEGREINIRGAHVQGYNTGSIGIVLLGNFDEGQPIESQLVSLRALVDYLRYTYEIRYLAGHKDYPDQSPDGTECPGANLYPILPGMAKELGMKYGIDGYIVPAWGK